MEVLRIKELGEVYTGKTPTTENPEYFGDGFPFVTPVDLRDTKYIGFTERYVTNKGIKFTTKIPPNTICVSCIGYIGKIGITITESCTNQQINSLIVNENFNHDYVYYLLSYNVPYFRELAGVNVVPQLNKSDFKKVKLFATRDKHLQIAIAYILASVDATLLATENCISAAHKLKKGLMQNLLTGKLKIDGTLRTEDEFYNHEKFGNCPIGWHWGRLSEIADVIAGQSPSGEYYNEDGIGMAMLNGPTEFTDLHPIPVQYTTKVTKLCAVDDILFTVRGSSTGRMNIADQEYCIGRGIAAIRAKERCDTDFIYYTLITISEKILAEAKGAGTTFPNVSRGELLKKWVLIPDTDQTEIAAKIKSVDAFLKEKQKKVATIQRLKKSLMQNLLTGKVRVDVNKIEKLLANAAF